ncbi:hypothetical protein AB0E85_05925 [Streptomyces sp. NPDC029044]|uniref:hypothetical protein n=1 Tax=Streptomyces sp. NPDC029044 TaxID=3157198 RepID=UPI003402BFA0
MTRAVVPVSRKVVKRGAGAHDERADALGVRCLKHLCVDVHEPVPREAADFESTGLVLGEPTRLQVDG